MWARRWRGKWGARYGRLAILDDVSLAREAWQGSAILGSVSSGILIFGPGKRDRFWAQIPRPKTVSLSDPQITETRPMQSGNGTTAVLLECLLASSHSASNWTKPLCLCSKEVGGETLSPRGKGSFLLSSHTRGHRRRSRGRACLTHVALISDRLDIQPLLPQAIVANEARISQLCKQPLL
jgi:hypothetical protein